MYCYPNTSTIFFWGFVFVISGAIIGVLTPDFVILQMAFLTHFWFFLFDLHRVTQSVQHFRHFSWWGKLVTSYFKFNVCFINSLVFSFVKPGNISRYRCTITNFIRILHEHSFQRKKKNENPSTNVEVIDHILPKVVGTFVLLSQHAEKKLASLSTGKIEEVVITR